MHTVQKLDELVRNAGIMPILIPGGKENEGKIGGAVRAIEQSEIPAVEILQRGDYALQMLRDAVKMKKNAYIGAGTVISLDQCKRMADEGADFIVTPGFDVRIAEWCVAHGLPIVPGVSTPSEIMTAYSLGLRVLKFFPFFDLGGIDGMKHRSGPFPDVSFVLTGFLDDSHLGFLREPKVAAIGGVWMFQSDNDPKAIMIPEEKMIFRLNESIRLAHHFRKGWD